nr:hypothetical protein [Actinomadura formosensis]
MLRAGFSRARPEHRQARQALRPANTRRCHQLTRQIADLQAQIGAILADRNPQLLSTYGVGPTPPRHCSSPPATTQSG